MTTKRVVLLEDARPLVRVPSRLAFAVLSAAAGLIAVAVLEPVLGRPYFFPAFAALILPAVAVGTRYGMLTTVLFAAGYAYWFLPPRGVLVMKDAHQALALAAYAVTGCFVAAIGGALRTAYARLREHHEQLDRVNVQREDLVRALTHDVRSPLSVIAMNADLLARTAGRADDALRRRALLIQSSVATIDSMLRDLVEVAALESGQVRLERAPLDVPALLAHVTEGLAGTLPVERVTVSVAGRVPPVRADPRHLERVMVNLVSNALKYSPGPVTVEAAPGRGDVVVSVHDQGPGIRAEDLPHVFDKYYRSTDAQSKEGLGLGLYISRLLVEAHGGRIWAESMPGQGTTFHVGLPAESGAPLPTPTPAPAR